MGWGIEKKPESLEFEELLPNLLCFIQPETVEPDRNRSGNDKQFHDPAPKTCARVSSTGMNVGKRNADAGPNSVGLSSEPEE